MTDPLDRDPERDPVLASLMRATEPDVAATVDWEGLRGRISDRAALSLARRRRSRRPWVFGAIATAAAAVGIALVIRTHSPPPPAVTGPVLGAATEQELERLISGRAEADALLQAVLEAPERDS